MLLSISFWEDGRHFPIQIFSRDKTHVVLCCHRQSDWMHGTLSEHASLNLDLAYFLFLVRPFPPVRLRIPKHSRIASTLLSRLLLVQVQRRYPLITMPLHIRSSLPSWLLTEPAKGFPVSTPQILEFGTASQVQNSYRYLSQFVSSLFQTSLPPIRMHKLAGPRVLDRIWIIWQLARVLETLFPSQL